MTVRDIHSTKGFGAKTVRNMGEPLISIALCTYNGARYLTEQLDSLLAQTYKNIEIVAVDDCSSDETVAILNEYAQRHSRMRVVVNAENLGFQRNFEYALSLCEGEFIAPCDQDDIWAADKLSDLHEVIGSSLMSYCNSMLIDAQGKSLHARMSDLWAMQDLHDPIAFVMENNVSGHAMLFRRELLTYALPLANGFFYDWWLAAVAASKSGVIYCPRLLVSYRQHASNITDVLSRRDNRKLSGTGLQRLRQTGERIAALANLQGRHHDLLLQLDRHWRARYGRWFSFSLAWFVARHLRVLFKLKKRSQHELLLMPLKYLSGVRLKRFFNRRSYPQFDN